MKKLGRTLARTLALLLIAAMLMPALAACKKGPADSLIGKWNAELDFSSYMQKAMEDESTSELGIDLSTLDFSGITLKISYEFDKDGNFKAEADEESAKTMMKKLGELMAEMFKTAFGGLLSDEMLLEALGASSWDELVESMMKDENGNAIDLGGLTGKGKYTVDGNKLTMTEDSGEKQTVEFSVSGSELKFISFESDSMSEKNSATMKEFMPIVFKKG